MKSVIVLLAAVTALSACGKKASEVLAAVKGEAKAAAIDKDIIGQFDKKCETAFSWGVSLGGGITHQIESYDFRAALKRNVTLFSDSECKNPVVQITESGAYTPKFDFPGTKSSKLQDGSGAHLIQLAYDKVTITPKSPAGVDALNAKKLCGMDKYSNGTAATVPADKVESCTGIKVETDYNSYSYDPKKNLILGYASSTPDVKSVTSGGKSLVGETAGLTANLYVRQP